MCFWGSDASVLIPKLFCCSGMFLISFEKRKTQAWLQHFSWRIYRFGKSAQQYTDFRGWLISPGLKTGAANEIFRASLSNAFLNPFFHNPSCVNVSYRLRLATNDYFDNRLVGRLFFRLIRLKNIDICFIDKNTIPHSAQCPSNNWMLWKHTALNG